MQAQHGLSLDAQQELIRATRPIAAGSCLRSLSTGLLGQEHGSARVSEGWPGLSETRGKLGAVVVSKLDRLTRSLKDILHISEDILTLSGCNLVAVMDGSTPSIRPGKSSLPLLAVIGDRAEQHVERVRSTIHPLIRGATLEGAFRAMTAEEGRLRKSPTPDLSMAGADPRFGIGKASGRRRSCDG